MKKILFLLTLCVTITSMTFGQEKFKTFDQAYCSKTFNVNISGDSTKYSLYIDALSFDSDYKQGGIILKDKTRQSFVNLLKQAESKYIEWINVAKQNNVNELEKDMSFKSNVESFFAYGDWQFDLNVIMTCRFKILDGKHLLIIETGELVSSSNEFMKHDGFAFVFSDVTEIDNLCDILSEESIMSYFRTPKIKDIFKD